jgi:HEXXH motif-containing protein
MATSFPPIDVASPHALAIDLEGVTDEATEPRRPLDKPVLERVLGALADTRDRIESTNPDILEFVNAFTKVLVLQRDDAAPTLFSTGSSAQYVGRSVFGNPHLESVDAALLAEGLVHEAIHSLLYMGERIEPWVTTPELYGPEHRTRSGWTGNPLPLRSYLQAAFVWYGLSQFWCQALSAGTFPADRIRGRIEQSVRGFLRGSVLDQIQPYRYGIAPEVCSAIESMESDIVDAVGAAC